MTRLVKRYPGGRLYDTVALAYTTADCLRACQEAVVVIDAKTSQVITATILDP